ncbi:SprB repeat-containing protein, partial [Flavobacterium aestuarii]|uniref:SprB repeat-containing protein n=1 Tax=Flavobacterium aestuarii TaxID=3149227 RepID=UPI0032B3357A
ITVSGVTGGTGVYSYAAVAGGAAAPASGVYTASAILSVDTNLNPANLSWDVYVKDANGCISMQNVVITNDAPPTITAPAPQCYAGSPLTVNLGTLLGTGTYNGVKSFTVNGSAISGAIATLAGPGTYTLGIKDDNGCEAFVDYKIENQLTALASLTKDLYCGAPVNAVIDVTIAGGVAPYSYQMYLNGSPSGVVTAVTGSSFTASVPAAGTYHFVITDSNAAVCSVTTSDVVVTVPSTPSAVFAQTDVSCNGGSDGTITITASNGVEPYEYSIDNGVTFQGSNYFAGLTDAGVYNIVVKDAKGCTITAAIPVDITQPAAVAASISVTTGLSCGTANAVQQATVTVTASGGTTPYQYSFDGINYSSVNTYTTSTSGLVQAWVKDGKGCNISVPVSTTVVPLNPPTDMNITGTPVYCSPVASQTSTVTLTTTSGVGTLSYTIVSPASAAGNISGASSGVFTLLSPDTYVFQVKDANGCTYQESYTVDPVTPIAI